MPEPTKIPRPFADSGDKNSIPDSSGGLGFASWQEGFPAITGTPFAQGGVAPKRADFNGVFNALSAAVVWAQQGGVYAYDATTDYEVGNITEKSGIIYICKTANGPSSSVKDPAADATETYWARLYPQSGTFNRMFFSQTSGSYTAPYTGVYRITLKGGGGGGSYQSLSAYNSWTGAGGGEGGTLIFYKTLTKSQSYAYVIGAGGDAGTGSSDPQSPGKAGGNSSFNSEYTASGGSGAPAAGYSDMGGDGGHTYTVPTGANAFFIPGQTGQSGYHFLPSALPNEGYPVKSVSGGGQTARYNQSVNNFGEGGNGGGTANPTAGGSGFILIEYAG